MNDIGSNYLETSIADFRRIKKLGERAFEQLGAADYHWTPDAESNSIAILIKHLGGNMRSRWTDFLTTDGEKETRERDGEFVDDVKSMDDLMAIWHAGWKCLLDALESLEPSDLGRTVYIRAEPHTVVEAISRQLWHYGLHVGQILFLARMRRGSEWKSLSIPRGQSQAYFRTPRDRQTGTSARPQP